MIMLSLEVEFSIYQQVSNFIIVFRVSFDFFVVELVGFYGNWFSFNFIQNNLIYVLLKSGYFDEN